MPRPPHVSAAEGSLPKLQKISLDNEEKNTEPPQFTYIYYSAFKVGEGKIKMVDIVVELVNNIKY